MEIWKQYEQKTDSDYRKWNWFLVRVRFHFNSSGKPDITFGTTREIVTLNCLFAVSQVARDQKKERKKERKIAKYRQQLLLCQLHDHVCPRKYKITFLVT